ncbi:hypothetical protein D8674_029557 [Pyrus ussuriensis x Pyrus communis]|uniref:DUF2828 domain-containing protein n=1 Tax=Pyrus ussuriensis x Pyrus communis TaxID=2448454 RepID=A0A5N5I6P0_9ROSA|nr:hypothetical protein D8674_029557 [Pyrus ussuriensis x Pyrus communis]
MKAANTNLARKISQLAVRLTAYPNSPTLVPPNLTIPGRSLSLMVPKFGNGIAPTAKRTAMSTRSSSRTPLMAMGFSTAESTLQLSSGDPCLDIFFNIVAPADYDNYGYYEFATASIKSYPPALKAEVEASCDYLKQLLPLAWSDDPLTTLKLICHLNDHRNGKSYEQAFYRAAVWLHQNHPKTLLCNIAPIASSFGRMGLYSLVELLHRLLQGRDGRWGTLEPLEKLTKKAVEMYEGDPDYKLLHDRVTDVFGQFKHDYLKYYVSDDSDDDDDGDDDQKYAEVTTAADCFLTGNHYESHAARATLLWESIARKENYESRVVDRLRKEVLAPLYRYTCSGYNGRNSWKFREEKGDDNLIGQVSFEDIWDKEKGWKVDRQNHVMEASISGKDYRSLVIVD